MTVDAALLAADEVHVGCATCPNVIASDDTIYCRSCGMYWEDVRNGLFDFGEH